MKPKTRISVIAATLLFGRITLAANATTISATGCADPSSMTSRLQAADTQLSTCVDEAGGNDEVILSCQWEQWIQQMVCYQASCWNKCQQYTTIVSNDLMDCQCCSYSAATSAFYGICPNTSPDGLDFFVTGVEYESVAGSCAGLTADLCASYGFWSADNGTFLDPANLPATGTQPLSTTAGPSSLTTPPAGATITWTALSQTFTVTASSYNAKNVASGSSTTGTGTATETTGSSGSETTATGTAASSAVSTGAASSIRTGNRAWAIGMLSVGGLVVML
ncbi:hypothetical protein UA08_08092 [Talaromyces atroroseus]|uniref:Extracellular membrane protein CFEM domain-containing protein n=1 Tax=Talaromyces atroroseus TaxID=1441469 RepID=A0A225AQ29_TALAT|nr:hypothetical protein UA08_08092 [Talaromyces atroroseus]OKL56535.1 hypothetical protein UA08_08092 [Talaromyces atroroseus]